MAIKKLPRPFLTKTHAKRTYRELKLLTALNHHDAQVYVPRVKGLDTNVNYFHSRWCSCMTYSHQQTEFKILTHCTI